MEECPHRGAASVDFVIVNRSIIRVRGAPETSGSTGLLSPDESRPHPFPSTGHAPHMKEWCEPRGSHGINTRPEPPTWVLPGLADVANALYLERLCRLPDSLPPFNALHSQDHLQRHGHVHGIAATRCPVQIRGDMLPRRSCPHVLGQMTEQRPGVAERLECHYSRPTGPCLRVSELWHFFGPTGSVQGSFSLWRNGFQESASRLALSKCPSSKSLPRHLKYSQRNDASGNSYTRSLGTHKSNFLAEINADLIAALRSCTLSGYPDDAFDPKRTWRRPICCAAHRPAHTDFAESQAL